MISQKGFSLIEMTIVVFLLGILGSIAFPLSRIAQVRQRELHLRLTLSHIREAIDHYSLEKRVKSSGLHRKDSYPESLEELVKEKFLRRIPIDPITQKGDWVLLPFEEGSSKGIFDIHTSSEELSLGGTALKEW